MDVAEVKPFVIFREGHGRDLQQMIGGAVELVGDERPDVVDVFEDIARRAGHAPFTREIDLLRPEWATRPRRRRAG